jgi:hypothetical protein
MLAYDHIIKKSPGSGAIRAGGNVIVVSWSGLTDVPFRQIRPASQ